MIKLDKFVEFLDVINYTKFHLCLMSSLRSSGESKRGFAFESHMALIQHCLALRLPCWQWKIESQETTETDIGNNTAERLPDKNANLAYLSSQLLIVRGHTDTRK
jgi:hypothetical protein